jgi:hypothetical protein
MEILPERLKIAKKSGIPVKDIMVSVVLSFLFFILLEKYFSAHPVKGIASEGHAMGPIGVGKPNSAKPPGWPHHGDSVSGALLHWHPHGPFNNNP